MLSGRQARPLPPLAAQHAYGGFWSTTGMTNAALLKYRAVLAAAWRRGMSGLCAGNGRWRHIQVRQQQGLGRLVWSAAPSVHVKLVVGQLGGARI